MVNEDINLESVDSPVDISDRDFRGPGRQKKMY